MPGPAIVVAGSFAASAGAATIAPAKPAVNGASGTLLALVISKNNAVHSCSTTGWSKLQQTNSGASFTASLWIAAESAAAPTFTWTGSVACSAQIAYYNDPSSDVLHSVSVSGTTGAGTTNPHSSTGFNTDAANALAIYVDACAANTALTAPTGWTQDVSAGSATSVTRHSFGSKAVATSGTASGNVSVNGGAAAWVQFQIELKDSAAAGLQASKVEAAAWLDPPAGLDASKLEAAAWLDVKDGAAASKIEVIAWLDAATLNATKIEAAAWLDPPVGLTASKCEVIAWLDAPVTSGGRRRMSLL